MLIERLIVRKTYPSNEIIREIPFHLKGLNLIVDTTTDIAEDTGNNVGKTTAIKVIDLCLGARSVSSLYRDEDTKSENKEIKSFLKDSKVEAELVLVNNQANRENKKYRIIRQLFPRGKRLIDDVEFTQEDFWEELKKILFDSKAPQPTFRQLIGKFVRVQDVTSEKMIKYIPGMASKETYDTIYSFLFKLMRNDLLSEREILSTELKRCENKLRMYEQDEHILSLDGLKQRQQIIEDEWQGLNNKRQHLDYMQEYKEELENKRQITSEIEIIESKIQLLELDIRYSEGSIAKLETEKCSIDISKIGDVYNEAKAYVGELNKTFTDVVEFHNSMIKNRISFIETQLDKKKNELVTVLEKRDELLDEKKNLSMKLIDEGLLEELNILNNKISKLDIERGEIQKSIELLESVNKDKQIILEKINSIDAQINTDEITNKISVFNTFFADYCEKMYGEKYLLVYHNDWKEKNIFPIAVDYFRGKVGTGMKKGVIVAFDLAYIKYAQKENIVSPQFVIHDKLENTHINQLKTIFELCGEIEGQYIVPILRERVNAIDSKLVEESEILELSTNDKFFRV